MQTRAAWPHCSNGQNQFLSREPRVCLLKTPARCRAGRDFSFRWPEMSRRRIVITAFFVVGLVILFLSFAVPVQREMGWIDAVTASTKQQTYLTFAFDMTPLTKTTPVIEPSPLAHWLARREGEVQYDWRHVNGTLKTIWGTPVGFGHGPAPPIYFLQGSLLEHFVDSSSDEDLRHFVDVMRHGTKQEQEAAVKAATDKALTAMSHAESGER